MEIYWNLVKNINMNLASIRVPTLFGFSINET